MIPLLLFLLFALPTLAADENKMPPRPMNYFPDRGDIVCINGNNRYTRALYGGHTRFRLETSDRPVFAVVKKGHHRNISLTANLLPLYPHQSLHEMGVLIGF